MADGDAEIAFGEAKEAMEKAIRSLRAEIQKVRTGRANASLLENIQVDYFGAVIPGKIDGRPFVAVDRLFDEGVDPATKLLDNLGRHRSIVGKHVVLVLPRN